MLEKILNDCQYWKILLLVRSDSLCHGLERVRENMRKFNVDESKVISLTTENIILGDLSAPDDFLKDPRLEQVTHVINCAAIASFGNNPFIWKVNVTGTLSFVKRMAQVKTLQRFLHVGTAMSCSPKENSIVTEEAAFSETGKHFVEYTRSKATIEQLIRKECPNLPLLIARPSIVVGHTCYGCLPSTSIFWVFRMGLMLQNFMCSLEDNIDVIPVDYCAAALLMLIESSLPNDEVVHVSAGKESSVRFSDIDKAIANVLNVTFAGERTQ